MTSDPRTISRLLVRCPTWVGDAVMATPTLRALRRRFPETHIALAGPERVRQTLEPGPFHDAFVALAGGGHVLADARRLRRGRYDLGVLLTNSFSSALALRLARVPRRLGYNRDGRGWLLTDRLTPRRAGRRFRPEPVLESYLRLAETLGCPVGDRRMELAVAAADEAAADALLAEAGIAPDRPLVVLAPGGTFGAAKLWPAERFARVADHLADRVSAAALVTAAPAEAEVARSVAAQMRRPAVNLAEPPISLGILKALVRRCAILVGNDSGLRHFAAAFDRPVVTIFGPTDPRWSDTRHPKEIALLPDCDCAPCQRRTCPTDHRCMQRTTVERVTRACDDLLERFPPGG